MVSEFGSNVLTGLTRLEIIAFLDGAVNFLETADEEKVSQMTKGASYRTFNHLVEQGKKERDPSILLANPEYKISTREINMNRELREETQNLLALIGEYPESTFRNTVVDKFKEKRKWITDNQRRILRYLVQKQNNFLSSKDIRNIEGIAKGDVQDYFRFSGTFSKLTSKLVLTYRTKSLSASVLMPGKNPLNAQATYALQQLQQDPKYFSGSWLVDDVELSRKIQELYHIKVIPKKIKQIKDNRYTLVSS